MRKFYLRSYTALYALIWRRRMIELLRILCGGLCTIDAGYRWFAAYHASIQHGHESLFVVSGWFASWLTAGSTPLLALWIAGTETLIAGCLLCGALTKLACSLGIFLSLLGCATTGVLTLLVKPGSFDLGILLLALLTFLGLSLANAGRAYSIDGLLARNAGRFSTDGRSFLHPIVQPALARSDTYPIPVAHTPRKRQRVLFM